MFRYLSFVFKNSMRNRRRSMLTISSIAISLCLLGVLMAIYRSLFMGQATPAQALRLVCSHKVSLAQSMPISYEGRIREVPGVRDVTVWQWFGGTYKDSRDPNNFFANFAVEPEHFLNIRSEYTMPEDQKLAFEHQRSGCVVSDSLAKRLNFHLGQHITLKSDIFNVALEFTLVGIYHDPQAEDTLYFNRLYLRETLGATSPMADTAGAFQIQANSVADVPRVAKAIDTMFDNSPAPTRTQSERQFQLSFVSFIGNLKVFLLAICGAVTFTILLVSANTISMSVRERVREVGILKTLGFTPGAILGIVLSESVVISLIGGAAGCFLAAGLCAVVRQAPAYIQATRTLSMTPSVVLLALCIAAFIGLVSSFLPAYSASRTSILDSLRYTG